MKILFLVQNFCQGWGGAPESVRLMARRLHRLGATCDVVDRGRLWPSIEQMDVLPNHRSEMPFELDRLAEYRGICHVGPWQAPAFLIEVMRHRKPQTPLVYLPRGGLARIEFAGGKRLKKLAYWLLMERRFVRGADAVVFSSQAEILELDRAVGRVETPFVIPDYFAGFEPAAEVGRESGLSVAFLAEISRRKGLVPLLRGVAKANLPPGTRLDIAGGVRRGEEAYFAEARCWITACSTVEVTCSGPLPHDQRSAFYGRTDIFVVSSLFESFGLTALEALSSGCHLVCTPDCGVSEYLPESRYVTRAESHEPGAIARALEAAAREVALPDHSRAAISTYADLAINAINAAADNAWLRLLNFSSK